MSGFPEIQGLLPIPREVSLETKLCPDCGRNQLAFPFSSVKMGRPNQSRPQTETAPMPTPSEAFGLARRLHQAGNLGEAEQLYRQVLQADPSHGEVWLLLGNTQQRMGK